MLKKLFVFSIALGLFTGCVATTNVPICNQRNIPPIDGPNSVENTLGQPIMWDQWAFPLQVTLDPNLSPEKREAVFEAMNTWNHRTGLRVFTYIGDGPDPQKRGNVWVTENELGQSPCGGQYLGFAHQFFRTDILGIATNIERAWIEFHSGTENERMVSTAIHEFGHVLGLTHDHEIESIMYPHNQPDRSNQIMLEDLLYVIDMISAPRQNSFYIPADIF